MSQLPGSFQRYWNAASLRRPRSSQILATENQEYNFEKYFRHFRHKSYFLVVADQLFLLGAETTGIIKYISLLDGRG